MDAVCAIDFGLLHSTPFAHPKMVIDKTTFWTVQNKTRLWYVPGPARQLCSGLVASSNGDGDCDYGAGSLALTPQMLMLYFYFLYTAPGGGMRGFVFTFTARAYVSLFPSRGFSLPCHRGHRGAGGSKAAKVTGGLHRSHIKENTVCAGVNAPLVGIVSCCWLCYAPWCRSALPPLPPPPSSFVMNSAEIFGLLISLTALWAFP